MADFPDLPITSVNIISNKPTVRLFSQSGITETIDVTSQNFQIEITLGPLTQADAKTLRAFIVEKGGSTFTFDLPSSLLDDDGATVFTSSCNAGATTCTTTASHNLGTGNYFKFANDNKVYISTSGSTGTTLNFAPPKRVDISGSTQVSPTPSFTVRFSDDQVGSANDPALYEYFDIALEEVLS